MKMHLYVLEREETPYPDEWDKCVVAATSEVEARTYANERGASQGYVWTDGTLTSCRELGEANEDTEVGVLVYHVFNPSEREMM